MRDATLFARQWAGLVVQARLLGEHIPGSRVAVISGAPHLANLERPGEWGDLVTGFLADLG